MPVANLTVMRKLLDFLVRKRHWFLFILLEIVSVVLIYRNNAYQRSVMFSSGNIVAGYVASVSGSVMSYLNLKQVNRELLDRNGQLEMEVLRLREMLEAMEADSTLFAGFAPDSTEQFRYSTVTAQVVSKSVTHLSNYMVIDKGAADGVKVDCGVVSRHGVVGVVCVVSERFAVVLPLLNPKSRLSCKVLRSNHFGSLVWNGRDVEYANLEELPRHADFQKGDTIVTSGYSDLFPAGIVVGTVEDFRKQHDDNFYSLRVRLATDFRSLSNVRVIVNFDQEERRNILKEARKND